jgi:hypothetical protein
VHAAILTPDGEASSPAGTATVAAQLGAMLGQSTSDDQAKLSPAELALMREWLLRLSTP